MTLIIFITFFCLVGLIFLHEFGHFLLAKLFKVKVEEFGLGFPPRIFGKKIGQTFFSLNLLPFGAFVKIYGEEERREEEGSFSQKPIWQRFLIVFGGVLSFWIIAFFLLTFLMGWGVPQVIADEENGNLKETKVQIVGIAPGSPAQISGLKIGDFIVGLKSEKAEISKIEKTKEVQEFTKENLGKEITLVIQRGKEIFEKKITPRVSPPEEEGPMGVVLARMTIKSYPLLRAPVEGAKATFQITLGVFQGWFEALKRVFAGKPSGVEMMGPVGVFNLFSQFGNLGPNYFLQFLAVLSIYLAIFNALPIPALDGGKILFLAIEGLRKKPVPQEWERKITFFFFYLFLSLGILVTIKDISALLK